MERYHECSITIPVTNVKGQSFGLGFFELSRKCLTDHFETFRGPTIS